ncbi:MAG: ATP-dependent protease LonB [Candidatus Micrarchaeaceae archaeon]
MDFNTTDDIKVPEKLIDQVIGQKKAVEIIKKAAVQRRNVLLIGEPGCIIGDERVFLSDGKIIKIKNFGSEHLERINKKVMTGEKSFAFARVFHKYKNQPVIKITTESGKTLTGTFNHPVLVYNKEKNREEWRRLDKIKEGEKVKAVQKVNCTISSLAKTGFKGDGPKEVTIALASIFGYASNKGRLFKGKLLFNSNGIAKKLVAFLYKCFADVTINSKYIAVAIEEDDFQFIKEGRIPDSILASKNSIAAAYIKWLFAHNVIIKDGIIFKHRNIEFLHDLQILLIRFGIYSSIKSKALHIDGHDAIIFANKIDFIDPQIKEKVLHIKALNKPRTSYEKVVKVEKKNIADTYDIEVPSAHRFIANGIIVHNTGKTMLAQAMAELLPAADLEDILVYKNVNDENEPLIKVVKTYPEGVKKDEIGQGRKILQNEKMRTHAALSKTNNAITPIVMLLVLILLGLSLSGLFSGSILITFAALILGIMIFGSAMLFITGVTGRMSGMPGFSDFSESKLIVDNTGMNHAPFVDATGSKAGALFGDVRHDPLQSGGLGTPAHLRVESGAIHKANKGVLFIDEISSLDMRSQQELLTAMQEKKYPITGQSEQSSGALVKTMPVPCDFILVAAGNLADIEHMHPALRSRIRGYGYEVYMDSTMDDNKENVSLIARFIAQEVKKDKKIPPFDKSAVEEIIDEARRRAGRKHKLTLILRDLGGLVRAAGDLAIERNKKIVTRQEVVDAKKLALPIEAQIVDMEVELHKDYKVFETKGSKIGRVNGLAVLGNAITSAGMIVPIVAEVTPASSSSEGKFISTGKLGKIANEAVKNVSAIIKKHIGRDVSKYDIHVQFLQTYEGIEGDSASISVAISVLSAMEGLPVYQNMAMTGSLSVRGDVLPVGGVTSKVEAAINAGLSAVIIPASNKEDVYLSKEELGKIKIITVNTLAEVIEAAIVKSKKSKAIIEELKHNEGV